MPLLTDAELREKLDTIVERLRAALPVSFERTVKAKGRLVYAA